MVGVSNPLSRQHIKQSFVPKNAKRVALFRKRDLELWIGVNCGDANVEGLLCRLRKNGIVKNLKANHGFVRNVEMQIDVRQIEAEAVTRLYYEEKLSKLVRRFL